MSDSGWIQSEDVSWALTQAGTGAFLNAVPGPGPFIPGTAFSLGNYNEYQSFIHIDTTAFPPGNGVLTLNVNAFNVGHDPFNLLIAPFSFAAPITTAVWRTQPQLAALTPCGSISHTLIPPNPGGPFTMNISAAGINAGGISGFILYDSLSATGTAPSHLNNILLADITDGSLTPVSPPFGGQYIGGPLQLSMQGWVS